VPELKRAAMQALNDDGSDDGVRFFVDRVLREANPEVRLEALKCLPRNFGENPDVRKEALRGLYSALADASAGPVLRKKIARQLGSYLENRKQTFFTPGELEKIDAVADWDKR